MPQSVTGSTTGGRPITAVPRWRAMVLALVLAVQVWAGCGGDNQAKVESTRDAAAVRPGHVPAASVEVATARPRLDPPPRAGSVAVEAGPFSDRVGISRLAFTHAGARPRVSGSMVNRVDVSEVIVLEVKADFYDREGRHVGSGSQVFQDAEAFDHADEAIRFDIRPRRPAQDATSAVLSVPQLVNE